MHSGSQVTTKNTAIAPVISSTKTKLLVVSDFFSANKWTVRLGFEMMIALSFLRWRCIGNEQRFTKWSSGMGYGTFLLV
jgi:hypothetical protein